MKKLPEPACQKRAQEDSGPTHPLHLGGVRAPRALLVVDLEPWGLRYASSQKFRDYLPLHIGQPEVSAHMAVR